jgi:hypothetical protein
MTIRLHKGMVFNARSRGIHRVSTECMNALLKRSRRNRLNASPYRDEIVLGQRQENAFCTIRPSPPITLSAANKPFAKTINLV